MAWRRGALLTDIFFVRGLGIMVVAAAIFVLVARLARVPSIVAYILAGLVLGPVAGILEANEAIDIIAEVGIVLLLFLVGLELSLDKIRDVGRVAVVAGLGQVIFTAAGGFVIAFLLGFSVIESIFLATALTFSSTVVVVKLLTEKGELDSLYGRIAVGIFLVQDLVVIVILTFLAGLGTAGGFDAASIGLGLLQAFGGMGLLLLIALLAARFLLPRIFGWISSSLEALFIWSLCWCFLLVVGAELLHLSIEIGAFIAGMSLAQLPYNLELRRRVHPLMNFFIAIFFTSLGLRMELGAALDQWLPALALSLFVLVGNPVIFMWIIARLGYTERTSFLTSVTVAQISEFSFIFAAMGLSAGLVNEAILSVVALVGLVTIAVSAYMILYNSELYARLKGRWVLRIFGAKEEGEESAPPTSLRGHVIVVGLNSLGIRLVDELIARGETVLAIDTDPVKLSRLHCQTLLGSVDHPTVLEEANLSEAKLVVSALQIEDTNNLLAYRCRQAGIPSSIHAFDRSVVDELREIGANHLMIPKNNGIRRMLEALRERGVVGG
jgi:Kef-type K+ transport system membrane component KefB